MQKVRLKNSIENWLKDPEILLKHPLKKDIYLEDIFVFPELRGNKEIINSRELLKINENGNGFIISGVEDSGKTSLVKVLFRHYYSSGYYPIYIDCRNIRISNPESIFELIEQRYHDTYDEYDHSIKKLIAGRKTVFLDNFGENLNKRGMVIEVLSILRKKFKNVIITQTISDSILSEIQELNLFPESGERINRYEIMEFSKDLRLDLIHKWHEAGTLGETVEISLKKYQNIEKLVDAVITNNLTPSYPVHILTMLNLDADETANQTTTSSYASYYEHIITKSLKASAKIDQLEFYLELLSEISYDLFKNNRQLISNENLRSFCGKHIQSESEDNVIDALLASGTIAIDQSNYSFKHKDIFQYFTAKYLSRNIDSESIRSEIKHICGELHREDYANIILFLTHQTDDPVIIEELIPRADSIFPELETFSMENDTSEINKLIEELLRSGAKHRKLKDLVVEYSVIPDQTIETAILDYEKYSDNRLLSGRDVYIKSNNILRIHAELVKNESLVKYKGVESAESIYKMALRTLNSYRIELDKITTELLRNSNENMAGEVLLKINLYNAYKKIFLFSIRQITLSIIDLNLNKISDQPDSILEMLLKTSSISEKILLDKTEIGKIAATIGVNTFASELFHEIIESVIKIKAIDRNREEVLVDILGARGVYEALTH